MVSRSDREADPGFSIHPDVFSEHETMELVNALDDVGRSRAGARHLMTVPAVVAVASDRRLLRLAEAALGPGAVPYRATLFDKSATSNWLVVWHQDTAVPLRNRADLPGWGPWSRKAGILYAQAPASMLERIVALRVHLDASTCQNGPLRVLPGSHGRGVLSDEEIHALALRTMPVECTVGLGGVLRMRPLLVHASSKALVPMPRRVLHLEYAVSLQVTRDVELAVA